MDEVPVLEFFVVGRPHNNRPIEHALKHLAK